MSRLIPTYIEQGLRIEHLERELAEVSGQRDLAVEELEIIASMIKKVLKECGK